MHDQKFQITFAHWEYKRSRIVLVRKYSPRNICTFCGVRFLVSFSFVSEYFNSVALWGLSWVIVKLPNLTEWTLGQGGSEPSFVHKIGCISSIWRNLLCELIFELKKSLVVNWFAFLLFLFIYHIVILKLHISSSPLK